MLRARPSAPSFVDAMCVLLGEPVTDTDEEVSCQNIFNALLYIVTNYLNNPTGAILESRWYKGSTTHRMHHDGAYVHVQANSGIDQGCPLSPCGFAAAVDPVSQYILSEIQRTLDNGSKLWAYLDDWYIWIKPRHITEAIELISTTTRSINL